MTTRTATYAADWPTTLLVPIRPARVAGEALDGYLERVADANYLTPSVVVRVLDTDVPSGVLADAGWALAGGSQACGACLRSDGIWRTAWRHPWVATCLIHSTWLTAACPTCGQSFRAYSHSRLRPIDATPGTCGNPRGARGRNCPQPLGELATEPAPDAVHQAQTRLQAALCEHPGAAADVADLTGLAVLLLHLAIQPGGHRLATWVRFARADSTRSAGDRGARWGLAPPADPRLRGLVLADADSILAAPDVDAAEALSPWLELAPRTSDGQLGWLADHTAMTPTLTRLVMGATSTRRRISTCLARQEPVPIERVPQVLRAGLYHDHLAHLIDVTDPVGRLFASLCVARRGRPGLGWADAAVLLGLPAELGIKTARACSAEIMCDCRTFIDATDQVAHRLAVDIDYRHRAAVVRHFARRTRWYRAWARQHHPGGHRTSRRYAVAWLWCEYAGGHLTTSPGWQGSPPDRRTRALYRRYAARLPAAANAALLALAAGASTQGRSR